MEARSLTPQLQRTAAGGWIVVNSIDIDSTQKEYKPWLCI